jgi:hypothetical protein
VEKDGEKHEKDHLITRYYFKKGKRFYQCHQDDHNVVVGDDGASGEWSFEEGFKLLMVDARMDAERWFGIYIGVDAFKRDSTRAVTQNPLHYSLKILNWGQE